MVKLECEPVKVGETFAVKVTGTSFLLEHLTAQVIMKSAEPIRVAERRIDENCVVLEGLAEKSGEHIVNLESSIPFVCEGEKSFYVRTPPRLATDKREYKIDESPRLSLIYDPRMSVKAMRANVSYYDFFSKSSESITFERTKAGRAEANLHALPPCTAEIYVELVYKEGPKDLTKKKIDLYGVLLDRSNPKDNELWKLQLAS